MKCRRRKIRPEGPRIRVALATLRGPVGPLSFWLVAAGPLAAHTLREAWGIGGRKPRCIGWWLVGIGNRRRGRSRRGTGGLEARSWKIKAVEFRTSWLFLWRVFGELFDELEDMIGGEDHVDVLVNGVADAAEGGVGAVAVVWAGADPFGD